MRGEDRVDHEAVRHHHEIAVQRSTPRDEALERRLDAGIERLVRLGVGLAA